jgi:threonyl-tRNA synthetase
MKEVEDRTVSVRRLGSKQSEVMKLEQLVADLKAESTPPDLLNPIG